MYLKKLQDISWYVVVTHYNYIRGYTMTTFEKIITCFERYDK